jgi:Mpv17 / PMP22 family
MGTFFVAPILHTLYSKILPRLVPELTSTGALKKLAIDQLCAAPLIILMFYPAINFVEGKPLSHAIDDLKAKYVATMAANYKIWPLANLINFMFVPIQYQVLWANFVSLFFNAVLSYMHNTYSSKQPIEESHKKTN